MNKIPAGSRAKEAAVFTEAGEEPLDCGFCGTRTEVDADRMAGPSWEEPRACPHCRQAYYLTDEAEDDHMSDLYDLGEIEVVDERSGEVVGMTSDDRAASGTAKLKARLDRLRAEEKAPVTEASQADLDHLFGIKRPPAETSPYGDDFGSFG